MEVRELKKNAKAGVVTCRPDDKVCDVASRLTDERIGALPVVDNGKMVGIISERDVCRAVARDGEKVRKLRVSDIMTRDVAVCRPTDRVQDAIRKMSRRHIRHLPMVEGGRLVGMISLRDVFEAKLQEVRLEAAVLRDYARTSSLMV